MTPTKVAAELDFLRRRLPRLILSSNYVVDGDGLRISWSGYKPGIANHVNYYREYRNIVDSRQYSFLLIGGAAIQFYYLFSNEGLLSARQCFYPRPFKFRPPEDGFSEYVPELADILQDVQESGDQIDDFLFEAQSWSHVRFDFDSSAENHEKSHLQYSALNTFRLPAKMVFTPIPFFLLILRDFYPDLLKQLKKKSWFAGALANSLRSALDSEILDGTFSFVTLDGA